MRKEVEVKIDHKMEAAISPSSLTPLKTERSHLTLPNQECSKMQYCLIPTMFVGLF